MRHRSSLLTIFLLLVPSLSQAGDPPAAAVFEELKELVGNWKPAKPESRTRIEVKLIANGSALVETWTMSPDMQSMTVYMLDGDRLLVTHYCPQGNAPRLAYTSTDDSGAHHFQFVDGANLQNPDGSHEHALWLRKEPDGTLTRNETYISNDSVYDPKKDTGDTKRFVRAR